jgi:hypothetical protein
MLSGLTIGGLSLSPTFAPNVESYTLKTRNNTNKVTATSDNTADISLLLTNSLGTNSVANGTSVPWAEGENELDITVSRNGNTKKYVVVVTKA